MCLTTEAQLSFLERVAVPPTYPIQCFKKLGEISGSSFQHCMLGAGDVREVKLYSGLPCAQKHQIANFFMICI